MSYLRNVFAVGNVPVCDQHHSNRKRCSGGRHEAWALCVDRHGTSKIWPDNTKWLTLYVQMTNDNQHTLRFRASEEVHATKKEWMSR